MRLKTNTVRAFGLWFLIGGLTLQSAHAAVLSQDAIVTDGYHSVLTSPVAENLSGMEESSDVQRADSTDTAVNPSTFSGRTFSPVDTLRMSPLERLFWKRQGLMRLTGLFPLDKDNPTNDLRQIAKTRRRMLSWHQKLGLLTIGSMAVTLISGQRALGGHNPSFHKTSVRITIGMYSGTALFALASPPKLVPKRGGVDTITFHKWFAVLHAAGMIITPLINPSPGFDYQSKARRHQIAGYITFSAFTAGMLTVMLFR